MARVTEVNDGVFWCEWRSKEANVWRDDDGKWTGDIIAYGEWGNLDEDEAEAVAFAFHLTDKLTTDGAREMFRWYFGGRRIEEV